jgi:NTE family protein
VYWFSRKAKPGPPVIGLILPGGGARNAYQVGVLKGIAEMLPENAANPFQVITGTSSGALIAVMLASNATQFQEGVRRLTGIWENFRVGKIFKSDAWTALKSGARWTLAVASGGLGTGKPRSLLDNSPMREMLESHVRFARIQHAINSGDLRAVAITTTGYTCGSSVTFYQGLDGLMPWVRANRMGIAEELTIDHLMASAAIPVVFPAVKLHNEYFGDGSMRESAPLSPALHLGADRLLIIGVRNPKTETALPYDEPVPYPSIGQITGYIFDTLFLDSLDADIERMNRINHTISEIRGKRVEYQDTELRPIDFLLLSPTRDIRELVEKHVGRFPRSVRVLLKGIGALTREGRPLISYLMFEGAFCQELIEMGYQDAFENENEIRQLLGIDVPGIRISQ